jgi:hypothetical protein
MNNLFDLLTFKLSNSELVVVIMMLMVYLIEQPAFILAASGIN